MYTRQAIHAAMVLALQAAAAAKAAAERARLEEAALPLMLEAMWAANMCDIELTVRHVCQRVGAAITSKECTRAESCMFVVHYTSI